MEAQRFVHILYPLIETDLGFQLTFKTKLSKMFTRHKHEGKRDVINRLHELGHTSDHLENSILAILVGSTVELSLGSLLPFLILNI